MDDALEKRANVTVVGVVHTVTRNCAMHAATSTVNVRTEPAFVSPAGMANIVRLKDVHPVVQIMVSAVWAMKDSGNVDATMDGMVLIVRWLWNKTVATTKTMTKVCTFIPLQFRFICCICIIQSLLIIDWACFTTRNKRLMFYLFGKQNHRWFSWLRGSRMLSKFRLSFESALRIGPETNWCVATQTTASHHSLILWAHEVFDRWK